MMYNNEQKFQTGDVVKISGSNVKTRNGLYFVEHSPGDPSWGGSSYCLRKIGKSGKISTAKYATEFWPLPAHEGGEIAPADVSSLGDIIRHFREKSAEAAKRAEGYESRGFSERDISITRAISEHAAAVAARLESLQTDEQRAANATEDKKREQDAQTIRIYWNGIKAPGAEKMTKCFYSIDNGSENAVTIYADDGRLPRDLFRVENDTDLYADYFDDDRTTVTPKHPLYKYIRAAAIKADLRHREKQLERLEKAIRSGDTFCLEGRKAEAKSHREKIAQYRAELENLPNGQPTSEDMDAVREMRLSEESARIAAEHEKQLAEREKALNERLEGRRYIEAVAAQYPADFCTPRVVIQWSEHPAFYDYNDGTLTLSVRAADEIFRHFDEQRAQRNREEGRGGYDKTAFIIFYSVGPKGRDSRTYEGRYDLGDDDGGIIEHIRKFGAYYADHPNQAYSAEDAAEILKLADILERSAYPERFAEVVDVQPAPWLEAAAKKWKSKRAPEVEAEEIPDDPVKAWQDIEDITEMFTDEQLEAAVFAVDPKDKDGMDIARFFLQKLAIRDEKKALDVFRRWKNGAA